MKRIMILLSFFLLPYISFSQSVINSSYITSSGERVLRFETIINKPKLEAWKLFSTVEGLKIWIAPVVSLDLRVGGEILTYYDSTKTISDPETIHLPIINYLEGEMITLKVILNNVFPDKARREDKNLQEIIQLFDEGKNKTKIVSSMVGWGTGEEWDTTYKFFERGNEWTYKELIKAIQ
jgi:uncharacterized protein YndB with AHSA1/START domain